MSIKERDNFKWTLIKFFLLALLVTFFFIGLVKNLVFSNRLPVRSALPSVAGGLTAPESSR